MMFDYLTRLKKLYMEEKELREDRDYLSHVNDCVLSLTDKSKSYIVNHPTLTKNDKDFIESTILDGNYPLELKDIAIRLYEYVDIDDLLNCANNLSTIKMKKVAALKISSFITQAARYDVEKNVIEYNNENSLSHEFLHMASSKYDKKNNIEYCGFGLIAGNLIFGKGISEGYTELLNRRIFYGEDYNTKNCYKINVYLLRIFELLYSDMMKDYFWANYNGPCGNFVNYGSLEEFFTFSKYLDWFSTTKIKGNEDQKMFNFINNIVKRTDDINKILLAEKYTEEYFASEGKSFNKVFSLKKSVNS